MAAEGAVDDEGIAALLIQTAAAAEDEVAEGTRVVVAPPQRNIRRRCRSCYRLLEVSYEVCGECAAGSDAQRVLAAMIRLGVDKSACTPPHCEGFLRRNVTSAAHTALAREAATASVVLLKNDDSLLPLHASRVRTIAIVGAAAVAPILADRSKIVRGELEPELSAEDKATVEQAGTTTDEGEGGPIVGVPEFWLSALGRNGAFEHVLEPPDVEALKFLVDVRCTDNDDAEETKKKLPKMLKTI